MVTQKDLDFEYKERGAFCCSFRGITFYWEDAMDCVHMKSGFGNSALRIDLSPNTRNEFGYYPRKEALRVLFQFINEQEKRGSN